jgi:hypothetical protein
MNRWGSREGSGFDLRLGVLWPEVEKIVGKKRLASPPVPTHLCTFGIDLHWTTGRRIVLARNLRTDTDYDRLGRLLLKDLLSSGIEWLNYRSELSKTLDRDRYRVSEGDGLWSSRERSGSPSTTIVFQTMLGKHKLAVAGLNRLATTGFRSQAVGIAKRLGIGLG